MLIFDFLASILPICILEASLPVTVTLPKGSVKGKQLYTNSTGKVFYAFFGIRYAEPPERFQPAVPIKPWGTLRDATMAKPACVQEKFFGDYSEDCLYLNVYTPNLPDTTNPKLAVMFWIHGGAFLVGSGDMEKYSPDFFLDEDVILVTFNYRLGAYGFMNSTNLGVKDAVVALQWIQENIQYFGGDSKKVTIFGESAGAVMVTYLMMSPLTEGKGYFQRAIAQGGNVLMPWVMNRHPEQILESTLSWTRCASMEVGVFDCMKRIDKNALWWAQSVVFAGEGVTLDLKSGFPYTPEYEAPGPGAAITASNILKLKNHFPKIPFIMGVNSQESALIDPVWLLVRLIYAQADWNPSFLVPPGFKTEDPKIRNEIGRKIRDFYFAKSWVSLSEYSAFMTYLSDTNFNKDVLKYIHLAKGVVPNYCYIFSYDGKKSNKSISDVLPISKKVGHTYELKYLFSKYSGQSLKSKDLKFKNAFVRLWTNFAKYGNPTPENNDKVLGNLQWPTAFVKNDYRCLVLDHKMRIVKNPLKRMYTFWKNLYREYGEPDDTF